MTSIDLEAFSGCTDLTLVGSNHSFARQYASDNRIPFKATDEKITDSQPSSEEPVKGPEVTTVQEEEKVNPQNQTEPEATQKAAPESISNEPSGTAGASKEEPEGSSDKSTVPTDYSEETQKNTGTTVDKSGSMNPKEKETDESVKSGEINPQDKAAGTEEPNKETAVIPAESEAYRSADEKAEETGTGVWHTLMEFKSGIVHKIADYITHNNQSVMILILLFVLYQLRFVILRVIEGFYAAINRKRYTCSGCKRIFKLPVYLCPRCGKEHAELLPKRGNDTFFRRCSCGEKLPASMFSGRKKLAAICPHCRKEM